MIILKKCKVQKFLLFNLQFRQISTSSHFDTKLNLFFSLAVSLLPFSSYTQMLFHSEVILLVEYCRLGGNGNAEK